MRAQSHVIGVALMLGLAIVALGSLTVAVGTVVDSHSANADASRVAQQMDDTLQAVDTTGFNSHRITFAAGSLETADRTLRLIKNGSVVETRQVDALVFEHDETRVIGIAGAVIRQQRTSAWLVRGPPITSSRENEVLVVGAPVLNASHTSVGGQNGVTTTIQTNVSHTRQTLGPGQYAIAIETKTPGPFERYFEEQNVSVSRRTFAADQFQSVVIEYSGTRDGYLVVHDLSMEVTDG